SPAQVVSLQKIQGQLQDSGALETIAHYLALLEEAYLTAALPKHSPRVARQRSAPPKLIVLSNALLAASDPRGRPDAEGGGARVERRAAGHVLARGAARSGRRARGFLGLVGDRGQDGADRTHRPARAARVPPPASALPPARHRRAGGDGRRRARRRRHGLLA